MLFSPLFLGAMAVLAIGSLCVWIYIAITEGEIPEELKDIAGGCGIIAAVFIGMGLFIGGILITGYSIEYFNGLK